MDYLNSLPSCLLHLIMLEFDSNTFSNFLQSNIVDDKKIDYKDLVYTLDNLLKENFIIILKRREEQKEQGRLKITYMGLKELFPILVPILQEELVHPSVYKILFTLLIDKNYYINYLNNLKELYLLDRELCKLFLNNKNFKDHKEIKQNGVTIKLGINKYKNFISYLKDSLYNNDNKLYEKPIPFIIDILLEYSYLSNINEITDYISCKYGLDYECYHSDIYIEIIDDPFFNLKYLKYLIDNHFGGLPMFMDASFIYHIIKKNVQCVPYMINKIFGSPDKTLQEKLDFYLKLIDELSFSDEMGDLRILKSKYYIMWCIEPMLYKFDPLLTRAEMKSHNNGLNDIKRETFEEIVDIEKGGKK